MEVLDDWGLFDRYGDDDLIVKKPEIFPEEDKEMEKEYDKMDRLPIVIDGSEHRCDVIKEFDCHVIDLGYSNPEYAGGFFTVFPISPLSYRKTSTNNKAEVSWDDTGEFYTHFYMTTDYGQIHKVSIPNYMKDEIIYAQICAMLQELVDDCN